MHLPTTHDHDVGTAAVSTSPTLPQYCAVAACKLQGGQSLSCWDRNSVKVPLTDSVPNQPAVSDPKIISQSQQQQPQQQLRMQSARGPGSSAVQSLDAMQCLVRSLPEPDELLQRLLSLYKRRRGRLSVGPNAPLLRSAAKQLILHHTRSQGLESPLSCQAASLSQLDLAGEDAQECSQQLTSSAQEQPRNINLTEGVQEEVPCRNQAQHQQESAQGQYQHRAYSSYPATLEAVISHVLTLARDLITRAFTTRALQDGPMLDFAVGIMDFRSQICLEQGWINGWHEILQHAGIELPEEQRRLLLQAMVSVVQDCVWRAWDQFEDKYGPFMVAREHGSETDSD